MKQYQSLIQQEFRDSPDDLEAVTKTVDGILSDIADVFEAEAAAHEKQNWGITDKSLALTTTARALRGLGIRLQEDGSIME